MSILSVDQIQPIGSGTTITLNATEVKTGTEITVGTGASIFSPAGNTLALGTNNVERIRIKNDGKVGIGTVSPDRMLHLNGTGNALVKMEGDYSGSVTGIEGVLTASGANRYVTGVYGKVVNTSGTESNVANIRLWNEQASPTTSDSPGYITFNTTNDGASTPTEKVRIASNGAIGLSGANYGTAGQVITSNGSGSAPSYQNVNSPSFHAGLISAADVNVTDNTYELLPCSNEEFDIGGCFNNTGSTVTLNGISTPAYAFAPNVAGYYHLYASVHLHNSAAGKIRQGRIKLTKNSSMLMENYVDPVDTPEGQMNRLTMNTSYIVYLNGTGDYVQALGLVNVESGTPSFEGNKDGTHFFAYKLLM